jgi:hypothetical protein
MFASTWSEPPDPPPTTCSGHGAPLDGTPPPDPAEVRARLHADLDRVLDGRAGDGGPALAEALVAWSRLGRAIDGATVEVVAGFDASLQWAVEGHRSPISWLVSETGIARAQASSMRRVSTGVVGRPLLAAAAASGTLTLVHLRLLLDARRRPVEDLYDRDEAELIEVAQRVTVDGLRHHLERWYHRALEEAARNEPDGPPPPAPEGNRLRFLPTFGGRATLDVDLDPVTAALVRAGLDAELERLRRSGALDADPRTLPEVYGDLFADIFERGLQRPEASGIAPLITATIDLDTLLRRAAQPTTSPIRASSDATQHGSGAAPDPDGPGPVGTVRSIRPIRAPGPDELGSTDRLARVARIDGHGPISDEAVAELAARARVALLVTDPVTGQALWFGRSRRLASAAQRRAAIAASDGHCTWPGCTVPADRCEIDHLTGWEQGGATDIENLAPCCRFHNRLKHRQRIAAARAPDGTVAYTRPDGTRIAPTYAHDP